MHVKDERTILLGCLLDRRRMDGHIAEEMGQDPPQLLQNNNNDLEFPVSAEEEEQQLSYILSNDGDSLPGLEPRNKHYY